MQLGHWSLFCREGGFLMIHGFAKICVIYYSFDKCFLQCKLVRCFHSCLNSNCGKLVQIFRRIFTIKQLPQTIPYELFCLISYFVFVIKIVNGLQFLEKNRQLKMVISKGKIRGKIILHVEPDILFLWVLLNCNWIELNRLSNSRERDKKKLLHVTSMPP